MALIHRVNTNFTPLLSTFYCKYTLNIARFKADQCLTNQLTSNSEQESQKEFQTFKQMITLRQNQAKRSILVQLISFDCIPDFEKFCTIYGNIKNIFPYLTKHNERFLLVEFESSINVEKLEHIATHIPKEHCIHAVTPLFYYQLQKSAMRSLKRNMDQGKNICLYPTFQSPVQQNIRQKLQSIKSVSEQMISLHSTLQITDLNIRLRFHTAKQLSYYVTRLFPNVAVIPFGSSVNGFGQIGCDLDLLCAVVADKGIDHIWKKFCMLSQPVSIVNREEQKNFLEMISMIIKTCVPGIYGIKKILAARVPIIKFENVYTNMQCDLSSSNTVPLLMSEMLYTYGELDWRVRPLVCTIRMWAKCTQITKDISGHWISNFSLTLLVIFYLQQRHILPSLKAMKVAIERHNGCKTHKNFNLLWFAKWKQSIRIENDESLYTLLYGFFEYYSVFDFSTKAICIKDGKLKVKRDSSPLYIYNPFDESLNVSKNVTKLELWRIVEAFRYALQILLESNEEETIARLIYPNQFGAKWRKAVLKPVNVNRTTSSENNNTQNSHKQDSNNELATSTFINDTTCTSESDVENSEKFA